MIERSVQRPIAVALYRGIRHSTDTHTDAQSAKKDVISTKPQKGHGRREDIPREEIEKGKRKRLRTLSLRGDPR